MKLAKKTCIFLGIFLAPVAITVALLFFACRTADNEDANPAFTYFLDTYELCNEASENRNLPTWQELYAITLNEYATQTHANVSTLSRLNREIFAPNAAPFHIQENTKIYLSLLREILEDERNLHEIAELIGIYVSSVITGGNTYNLIKYDANPIGHGTLERTWSFLQIVGESGDISVYPLYLGGAEVPLHLNVVSRCDNEYIIALAGVTNISRRNTVFMSFWVYNSVELVEFDKISFDETSGNLCGNMYNLDFFHFDHPAKIEQSAEENGLFVVSNNGIEITASYFDGVVLEVNEARNIPLIGGISCAHAVFSPIIDRYKQLEQDEFMYLGQLHPIAQRYNLGMLPSYWRMIYAFHDITGNGQPDLIIGAAGRKHFNPYITGIYALVDGISFSVMQYSGGRESYYLLTDAHANTVISQQWGHMGNAFEAFYSVNYDGELILLDEIWTYDFDMSHYNETGELIRNRVRYLEAPGGTREYVTEEEYVSIMQFFGSFGYETDEEIVPRPVSLDWRCVVTQDKSR